MRSFMRNVVAMQQMKTKLSCLKPYRPYTVDFPIYAREKVKLSEILKSLAEFEVVLEIISKVYLGREHNISPPPYTE